MKIAVGSDHGGFALKQELLAWLGGQGYEFHDFGTYSEESCDYPEYARLVADAVYSGGYERGILCCGTGVGISMAANKCKGIRAALCSEPFSAKYTRLHNDANVLCMGGRTVGPGLACEIADVFLTTAFEGGRHARRVAQMMELADRD